MNPFSKPLKLPYFSTYYKMGSNIFQSLKFFELSFFLKPLCCSVVEPFNNDLETVHLLNLFLFFNGSLRYGIWNEILGLTLLTNKWVVKIRQEINPFSFMHLPRFTHPSFVGQKVVRRLYLSNHHFIHSSTLSHFHIPPSLPTMIKCTPIHSFIHSSIYASTHPYSCRFQRGKKVWP